jgi:hypothetical protein
MLTKYQNQTLSPSITSLIFVMQVASSDITLEALDSIDVPERLASSIFASRAFAFDRFSSFPGLSRSIVLMFS